MDSVSNFLAFPQVGLSPKASYWAWLKAARFVFSNTGTRQYGHIGITMDPDEYEVFHEQMLGPVIPPVPPAHAPPRPALVPYVALAAPPDDFRIFSPVDPALDADEQKSADTIALSHFNRLHARFDKERSEVMLLRNRLMASISFSAQAAAGNATNGFMFASTRQIFALMEARFGVLVASEIEALEVTLEAKWTTGTIASHIAIHRQVHDLLFFNHCPMSMPTRISKLAASLSTYPVSDSSHPFYVEIKSYRMSNPNVEDLAFEEFAILMETIGADHLPAVATAISSAKKTSSKTKSTRTRYFCTIHGEDSSHDTAHCREVAKRHAAGGGGTK